MSEHIKFRAWDGKNKQFADYEDIEECLSCQSRDGWESSDGMGCCFGINAVEILADCIIEQYTGLKDKNGKEIYEGDIVNIQGIKYYVDFEHGGFWFNNNNRKWKASRPFTHFQEINDTEVIGNIHENEELLGERK